MKTFKFSAAQGDLFIMKIDSIPATAKLQQSSDKHVVAHSETGHHHTVEAKGVDFFIGDDPQTSYLDVKVPFAALVHERPFDTHETLQALKGKYIIKRQREWTPEGWAIVQD